MIPTISPVDAVRAAAHPLHGLGSDFNPLMRRIGDARFVLIGGASHGTHEFYRARAELTKRLIREKGFAALAVEADWPDAYRVNRFVRRLSADAEASEALGGFQRFPHWLWRNADVLEFVDWLRAHNDALAGPRRAVGFYGLDLYNLQASIETMLQYLDVADPEAARRARARFERFDHVGSDVHWYASASKLGLAPASENELVAQLVELRGASGEAAKHDGAIDPDALFQAEQSARVVRSTEAYYRNVVAGGIAWWNLRDRHMAKTLQLLAEHLRQSRRDAKVAVWAHNSHLGDATWTSMGTQGESNVGQFVRERHPQDTVLIGLTTYTGTITATSEWDAPAERMPVRPAYHGSYEELFHESCQGDFMLLFDHGHEMSWELGEPRLERSIGVVYRRDTERLSHYFNASISRQFDAVLHYDVTRAVEPLDRTSRWNGSELPETFPSAL